MAKAKMAKQLSLSGNDRVGLLTEITSALAAAKISINAICAYAMDNRAYFMMLTDSNTRAKKAVGKLKIKMEEDDVVSVEISNAKGSLNKTAKKISDAGINIYYIYATAASGRSSLVVLSTSDNKKAVRVINSRH